MNHVYCAKCGAKLMIKKIGLPAYAKIINVVPVHECGEVQNLESTLGEPEVVVRVEDTTDNEFVSKTNDLRKKTVFDTRLGDRRPKDQQKDITSTAPKSLIDKVLGKDIDEDF